MKLKIKFDGHVVEQLLEEGLAQVGLEEERERIIVSNKGGLAYLLFEGFDWINNFPAVRSGRKIESLDDMKDLRAYFDIVESYIEAAEKHARKFKFQLVSCDGYAGCVDDSDISKFYGTMFQRGPSRLHDLINPESSPFYKSISPKRSITSLEYAALGSASIKSVERLEQFLQMVKGGKEELQERYVQMLKVANFVRYGC